MSRRQLPIGWRLRRTREEAALLFSILIFRGGITCGQTVEDAVANAADAKRAWIEAALEEGIEINEPNSLEDSSGQFKMKNTAWY